MCRNLFVVRLICLDSVPAGEEANEKHRGDVMEESYNTLYHIYSKY